MGRHCDFCGKKVVFGNSIARRGKAKYLGGVGRKITGITRRKFKPNVQRLRILINGAVTRKYVCTKCLRSGVVKRPVIRKPFTLKEGA